MKTRAVAAAVGVLVVAFFTWLWRQTQSTSPEEHARIDGALRELRSLDRAINQDVLRARFQLISSYDPVLRSYRRLEELEAAIATPPRYLEEARRQRLAAAVAGYRAAVTAKQAVIEIFKYRTADLRDLLGYLPGAGTGVAKAASDSGDESLAAQVNQVLQLALLYNVTSDETYAPALRERVDALAAAGSRARTYGVKARIGTLVVNIRRLLVVKPEVDRLLRRMFDEPVVAREEEVAAVYYAGYAAAEHTARGYRVVLYGSCVGLMVVLAAGMRRLQRTGRALAASNERQAIAARLQASMLPGQVTVEGLEIAAGMLPSDGVGGDYYDIIPVEDGCWIAIGDVAGHGLGAGLIMLMLQSTLQGLITLSPRANPRDLVCALNAVLYENIRRRGRRDEHVTFCLLRYWSDGRIAFAGAHEEIFVRRTGGASVTLTPLGAWLGAKKDVSRSTVDTADRLHPGDVMLLYTDGMIEARDAAGETFGEERLRKLFQELGDGPPSVVRSGIIAAVRAWGTVDDDQTVVVVRCEGPKTV